MAALMICLADSLGIEWKVHIKFGVIYIYFKVGNALEKDTEIIKNLNLHIESELKRKIFHGAKKME